MFHQETAFSFEELRELKIGQISLIFDDCGPVKKPENRLKSELF